LLGASRIVPVAGLALAPWRLYQVAGRFVGPEPSAPLSIPLRTHDTKPVRRVSRRTPILLEHPAITYLNPMVHFAETIRAVLV
jgi:hypothetical protein